MKNKMIEQELRPFWVLLPIFLFMFAGVSYGSDLGWSIGGGIKSHSQNNILRHWYNSLGGYSAAIGLLSIDPKSGWLELELDFGLGKYREYLGQNKVLERFGFTSIDARLGLQLILGGGGIAPHLGFGGILFNGFAPHKSRNYVEKNVYKGMGVYISVGPSLLFTDEFLVIGDINYAYMGNISKDDYDPMGILELRVRMVFVIS